MAAKVWVVGGQYDGGTFYPYIWCFEGGVEVSVEKLGTTADLIAQGVWGANPASNRPSAIILSNGTFYHDTGSGWTPKVGPGGLSVYLRGISPSDLWASGMQHYTGSSWAFDYRGHPAPTYVRPVLAFADNDIWTGGGTYSGKNIWHWDGATWTASAAFPSGWVSDLWGTSSSDIWACSMTGQINHWNGSSWQGVWTKTGYAFTTCFGLSASDIWFLGYATSSYKAAAMHATVWNDPGASPAMLPGGSYDNYYPGGNMAGPARGLHGANGKYYATGADLSMGEHSCLWTYDGSWSVVEFAHRFGMESGGAIWVPSEVPSIDRTANDVIAAIADGVVTKLIRPLAIQISDGASVVSQAGGVQLILTAPFVQGVPYRVHMGPLGSTDDPLCYGGHGYGYDCYSWDGATMAVVTPPVANNSPGAQWVYITMAVSEARAGRVTVVEAPLYGKIESICQGHPPWVGVGPRRVELIERRRLLAPPPLVRDVSADSIVISDSVSAEIFHTLYERLILSIQKAGGDQLYLRAADGTWSSIKTQPNGNGGAPGVAGFPGGEILQHCNGYPERYVDGTWTEEASYYHLTYLRRYANYANVVWGVGTGGVHKRVAGVWTTLATQPPFGASRIWGVSDTECWATHGFNGISRTIDGGASWQNLSAQWVTDTGVAGTRVGIYGFSSTSIYIVANIEGGGRGTYLVKWDGSNFHLLTTVARSASDQLWGASESALYFAGLNPSWSQGLWVFKWNGASAPAVVSEWTPQWYGEIADIWGLADDTVIVVLNSDGQAVISENGGANWASPPASWPTFTTGRLSSVKWDS